MGEGPAATSEPPTAPEAPTVPDVPTPPSVQQAEIPTPASEVPPPPPIQQPETPPPTPVQQVEIPEPAPDMPPPPVQQAATPPPTPAPAPMPIQPPSQPVVDSPRLKAPPQRAVARASSNPAAAPAHAPAGQSAAGGASNANNGAAWMGKLKQWWDQHSFYPKEASQTNEGGNVRVHIVIAPDGQVTAIEVVQSSGLSVLDAAAVAVFRNAHLPPFPPGTPAQPADVVVTLHYHPADSSGG